jgi:hypothetical protein
METIKEAVLDFVIAVFLFTVTAGSCHAPRACHDRPPHAEARSSP